VIELHKMATPRSWTQEEEYAKTFGDGLPTKDEAQKWVA